MKLQIALDDVTMEQALELLAQVEDQVDIAEVGTPFMMEYGMEAVRKIRERFPDLEILCDTKIMDAGAYEAGLAYRAGADYVTVLGVTDDRTIQEVAAEARRASAGLPEGREKKVVADMICVEDLPGRIARMEELGVHVIAVHTGVDQQAAGRTPLDDLREMRAHVKSAHVAVAGGIRLDTLDDYLEYHPEILIVGGGIAHAENPAREARALAERIHQSRR